MFPVEMDESVTLQIAPRAWITLQDAWHAVASAPATAPNPAPGAGPVLVVSAAPGAPAAPLPVAGQPPRSAPLTPWASLALRTGAPHRARTH